ncbi:MAG: hypothetical protein LBH82_03980 [Bacteroidales bacterium]|jgi:hypothetical protein|nr:hypothetical protein [Bacteroidales bacterium]
MKPLSVKKENVLIGKTYCTVICFLLACFLLAACDKENDETINENCNWNEILPLALDENLTYVLDNIFSDNNSLVADIEGDTLLFVICNQEDFLAVSKSVNTAIGSEQIDFENHCIIWGRVLTPQFPYTVQNKGLFVCDVDSSYKYEVAIEECTDCWTAFDRLYFWGVYPKIENENIVLTFK